MRRLVRSWLLSFVASSGPLWASPPPAAPITADAVEQATTFEPIGPKSHSAATLRIQILLDRAMFSSGEMDAMYGSNLKVAVAGFQKRNGLTVSGTIDEPTWDALARDPGPVIASYTIGDADVAGPFTPIPQSMMEQSTLPAMSYASPGEALGERFHVSPALLQELNPGKDLAKVGEVIAVPNVRPEPPPVVDAARVVVDRSDSTVRLEAKDGTVLAQFPASTGSRHDPLPIGNWKVQGVRHDPDFHYNPKLFWDAKKGDRKSTLQPGPNNPVGIVWVDLSKAHYGIHGTPEPSHIGKTQSHGCIRLTNWDAFLLSQSVRPGMPAVLQR